MRKPDSKLSSLRERIAAARRAQDEPDSAKPPGSVSHGMRVGLDLVSGVGVGTAVGYGLDVWLGTLPVFMLLCMGLGTAAGVKLMMESARRAAAEIEEEEKRE